MFNITVADGYFVWNNIKFELSKHCTGKNFFWEFSIPGEIDYGQLWDFGADCKVGRFELFRGFRCSGADFEIKVWGKTLEDVLVRGFLVNSNSVGIKR